MKVVETVSIDERYTLIQVKDDSEVIKEKRVRDSQASHYEKLLRQKHCKIVL